MAQVVISVHDGMADVWGDNFIKGNPIDPRPQILTPAPPGRNGPEIKPSPAAPIFKYTGRKQVLMPNTQSARPIVDTIKRAVQIAGTDGEVIFNVGHGATTADDETGTKGSVDLGPPGVLRLGGFGLTNVFVDIFYDTNVPDLVAPPTRGGVRNKSQQKFDQEISDDTAALFSPGQRAAAQKRQANWAMYREICVAFNMVKPYRVVFLTCRVGNSPNFLRKIAIDWDVVVVGFKKRVMLAPQDNRRVRLYLEGDAPDFGSNVESNEYQMLLPTERNSVQVGPAWGPWPV
jgi:hypothetical protein